MPHQCFVTSVTGHDEIVSCISDDDTGRKGAFIIGRYMKSVARLYNIIIDMQILPLSMLYLWELCWHFSQELILSLPWDINQQC